MEYSIRKYNKEYTIECKVVKKVGFLLWQRTVETWVRANRYGEPVINPMFVHDPFDKMKKAKKQVKEWQTQRGVTATK